MSLIALGPKPPLIVARDATIHALTVALTERNVGAAAVLDGDRLVGIVTERDVIKKVVAPQRDPHQVKVSDLMSSPVITVGRATTLTEAVAIMRDKHIRHLVVVSDTGKVLGILALRYVLYAVMDDLERTVGDMTSYIMLDSPGG
ncbi:MAG: cyclic nucleotide-binding/CBS domain-containing protein [Gammaproteobacteria bacterium]